MSLFSADWLALREPADHDARSARIARAVADRLANATDVSVLDLGAGTGSNLRYLIDKLPNPQSWSLVDHDPSLLAVMPEQLTAWCASRGWRTTRDDTGWMIRGAAVTCRVATQHSDLRAIVEGDLFANRRLVTASALLDLVSADWLRQLALQCQRAQVVILFALTYDGRFSCTPEDEDDELVRSLINRHQRTDKGLGEALGPSATDAAQDAFQSVGYQVLREPSDWVLGPESPRLQEQLIAGWATAAVEIAPERERRIEQWHARRLARVRDGSSRIVVGHQDLGAFL